MKVLCPVCDCDTSRHVGDVDFAKTCEDHKGVKPFPPAARPIEYRQCMQCGATFAPWMVGWPRERFAREVYDDAYLRADPEADGTRARQNAAALLAAFPLVRPRAHLDYGGGDGTLARVLRDAGWQSSSFDPLYDDRRPDGTFDLITAFEVIEHVPDVKALVADLVALSGPDTVLICTTLLHEPTRTVTDSWYVAPRNGHVVIHSRDSLRWMLGAAGYVLASDHVGSHTAHRRALPNWYQAAAHG